MAGCGLEDLQQAEFGFMSFPAFSSLQQALFANGQVTTG